MPQPSAQHRCSTGGLHNFFSANLECWRRFLSCELHKQEVLKGACVRRINKKPPLLRGMLKLKFFHQPTDIVTALYQITIHWKVRGALWFVCGAISGQKQKDCHPTSSYSSDIAPCNFLFSELKMSLKGRRHNDITMTEAKPWDSLAKFQILQLIKGSNGGAITWRVNVVVLQKYIQSRKYRSHHIEEGWSHVTQTRQLQITKKREGTYLRISS